jgi:hypothetical protein
VILAKYSERLQAITEVGEGRADIGVINDVASGIVTRSFRPDDLDPGQES